MLAFPVMHGLAGLPLAATRLRVQCHHMVAFAEVAPVPPPALSQDLGVVVNTVPMHQIGQRPPEMLRPRKLSLRARRLRQIIATLNRQPEITGAKLHHLITSTSSLKTPRSTPNRQSDRRIQRRHTRILTHHPRVRLHRRRPLQIRNPLKHLPLRERAIRHHARHVALLRERRLRRLHRNLLRHSPPPLRTQPSTHQHQPKHAPAQASADEPSDPPHQDQT